MNELQKEAYNLASEINEISMKIADKELEYEKLKFNQTQLEINVDLVARDNASAAGTKITEKLIENIVLTNPDVITQSNNIMETKRDLLKLKAILEGFRTKRDMITAISRMGE